MPQVVGVVIAIVVVAYATLSAGTTDVLGELSRVDTPLPYPFAPASTRRQHQICKCHTGSACSS